MATIIGGGSVWSILKETAATALPAPTTATWAAGQATLTFAASHSLAVGQQVNLSGWTPAAWNGTWRVSSITSATVAVVDIPFDPGASTTRGPVQAIAYGNVASSGTARKVPLVSESLDMGIAEVDLAALTGGGVIANWDSWRQGQRTVEGGIQTQLYDSGATLLWEAILGQIGTTGPVTGRYTHTATPTRTLPSYLVRVGLGGDTAVFVKTVLGAKVAKAEIKGSADGPVTLGVDWVGREMQTSSSGNVTGTLPSAQVAYRLIDSWISIGGANANGCIKGFTLSIDNKLDADFCAGSPYGKEPERNGFAEISGSLDMVFDTIDPFIGYFTAGTYVAVRMFFGVVGASPYEQLQIDLGVTITGGVPAVSDAGKVNVTVPFKAWVASGSTLDSTAIAVTAINADSAP